MYTTLFLPTLRKAKWSYERWLGERYINFHDKGQINFIDVGAIGWLPDPWNIRKNTERIHSLLRFEPQEQSRKTSNIVTIDTVLWEENCERDFYFFSGAGGGASLFEQNQEFVRENFHTLKNNGPRQAALSWFERSRIVKKTKIHCRSLDNVLSEQESPLDYNFLKVDAQGAEYQILRGAENFLKTTCIGLHLELFVLPLYKKVRLLPDVVTYLASLGFDLLKMFPAHGTFDSQHDCVFIKRGTKSEAADIIRMAYGANKIRNSDTGIN